MGRSRGEILINVDDIIGKRLGKLEVMMYAGYAYHNTKGGERVRHFYICECKCGHTCLIQRGNILNEHIHSCGCGRRKEKWLSK